jgi:hypothetical protein
LPVTIPPLSPEIENMDSEEEEARLSDGGGGYI